MTIEAPRLRLIPIGYLRKGDRFVLSLERPRGIHAGVADMDGHYVSDHYGVRMGNFAWVNSRSEYVNVKWDGRTYSDPGYPNDTLAVGDAAYVLVSNSVYERYRGVDQPASEAIIGQWSRAKAEEAEKSALELKRESQRQELLKKIAELREQVKNLS